MDASIKLYEKEIRVLTTLPDENLVLIVRSLLLSAIDEEMLELDPMSNAVFELIKAQTERARDLSEKRKESGSRGGASTNNANAETGQANDKQKQANAETGQANDKQKQANAETGQAKTSTNTNTNTSTNTSTNTKESESAYAPTPATSQSEDEIGHCKSECAQPITDTANTTSNPVKTCKSKWAKPTVDEIRAYCMERRNDISPQRFFDYYESKGWIVGKSPMRDWKAAVRTWEQNGSDNHAQKQEAGGKQNDKYAGMCGDTVYL
ncbi:hypothetical protein AGMMS49975_07810 [Clostridia bacterium]|nr:hypothetical protein AGMMS49975_07810 [Clostridia bacterium]